jgi:hypothetical protein
MRKKRKKERKKGDKGDKRQKSVRSFALWTESLPCNKDMVSFLLYIQRYRVYLVCFHTQLPYQFSCKVLRTTIYKSRAPSPAATEIPQNGAKTQIRQPSPMTL